MSMQPLAVLITPTEILVAVLAALAGLVAAYLLGAFQSRSVAGPARTSFDADFAPALWGVAFIGFGAWLFVPSFYVVLTHRPTSPTTMPTATTTSPTDLAPTPD